MTWNRSSLLLLPALAVLAACGGEAPDPHAPPAPSPYPLVRLLEDPDPAVRRRAAEGLGRLEHAPHEAIQALMVAQYDDDRSVAEAAVAALDRIHPDPEVALRVFGGDCYEEIAEDVMVRPAYVTWRRLTCEPGEGPKDARRGACWMLAEIPPVYETRIKHVLVHPEAGRWGDAREVRPGDVEALRASPPPPPVLRVEKAVPPEGEPEGAQPGEVWCWYETASGVTWKRHPECEIPASPR